MNRHREDDASDDTTGDAESNPEPVVPEEGEGPFPPVAGQPRPPIGN
ncbi:hypothetical protein [Mycobacterium sp. Marseille-P9652]|nr:hypothetical protein [Mycobacterium sp. Marseille-P9652]